WRSTSRDTERSFVRFPAPFAPSRVTTSPAWTVRSIPRSAWMPPYRTSRPRSSRSGRALTVSFSEVGLDPRRVLADGLRLAEVDQLAEVEDGDAVAEAHDERHVVLDEHHGQVELRDDRPDERAQLALLVRVHPRRRLVHQERGRTERESAGDL